MGEVGGWLGGMEVSDGQGERAGGERAWVDGL